MKFDSLRHVIMSYLHFNNHIKVPRARALEAQQWHRCRVPRRRAGHLRERERRHGAQGEDNGVPGPSGRTMGDF